MSKNTRIVYVDQRKVYLENDIPHREDGPASIEVYDNGSTKIEEWYFKGALHRMDGPARTEYFQEGSNTKKHEWWYRNWVPFRDSEQPIETEYYFSGAIKYHMYGGNDKRVIVEYHKNGKKAAQSWKNSKNEYSRDGGPYYIQYSYTGAPMYEKWFVHGDRARKYIKQYYGGGETQSEKWYKDDCFHREDGPAVIWYRENGNKSKEFWYRDGKFHRDGDEPAVVHYYENGNMKKARWMTNGVEDKEEVDYWSDGTVKPPGEDERLERIDRKYEREARFLNSRKYMPPTYRRMCD